MLSFFKIISKALKQRQGGGGGNRGGLHSRHLSVSTPLPELLKRAATVSKSDEEKQNRVCSSLRYKELPC